MNNKEEKSFLASDNKLSDQKEKNNPNPIIIIPTNQQQKQQPSLRCTWTLAVPNCIQMLQTGASGVSNGEPPPPPTRGGRKAELKVGALWCGGRMWTHQKRKCALPGGPQRQQNGWSITDQSLINHSLLTYYSLINHLLITYYSLIIAYGRVPQFEHYMLVLNFLPHVVLNSSNTKKVAS